MPGVHELLKKRKICEPALKLKCRRSNAPGEEAPPQTAPRRNADTESGARARHGADTERNRGPPQTGRRDTALADASTGRRAQTPADGGGGTKAVSALGRARAPLKTGCGGGERRAGEGRLTGRKRAPSQRTPEKITEAAGPVWPRPL